MSCSSFWRAQLSVLLGLSSAGILSGVSLAQQEKPIEDGAQFDLDQVRATVEGRLAQFLVNRKGPIEPVGEEILGAQEEEIERILLLAEEAAQELAEQDAQEMNALDLSEKEIIRKLLEMMGGGMDVNQVNVEEEAEQLEEKASLEALLELAREQQASAPVEEFSPEQRELEALLNLARKEQAQGQGEDLLSDLLARARKEQAQGGVDEEPTSEQLAEEENIDQLLRQAGRNQQAREQERLEEARNMDEPEEAQGLAEVPQQPEAVVDESDPRAWLENLIAQAKAGERFFGLGFGQFSLRPGISEAQIEGLSSNLRTVQELLAFDPYLQIAAQVREQEDHAIVLLAVKDFRLPGSARVNSSLLIVPFCLLRTEEGSWQISASVSDFLAADISLDAATQARLQESLRWARETAAQVRPELEQLRQQAQQTVAQEISESKPTQAAEMLNLAAEVLMPSGESLGAKRLESLRSLLGKAGANLDENQLAKLWLKLEAFNLEQNRLPSVVYEIAFQDSLIEEKGDDLRRLVLLRPTSASTQEQPLLAALYLRRKGDLMVFSPARIGNSEFPSLSLKDLPRGDERAQSLQTQRDKLLSKLIQRAGNREIEGVSTDSPEAVIRAFIAAARSGDWEQAFSLVSLTQKGVSQDLRTSPELMVQQLLRVLDTLGRGMIAPRFQRVYETKEGNQSLWILEGINRANPSLGVIHLPLSMRQTEQGWLVDFAMLANAEAVNKFGERVDSSSYQLQWNQQAIKVLAETTLDELAPLPTPKQSVVAASEPASVWLGIQEAWSENQVSQVATSFLRLSGADEERVLTDFLWFFEALGDANELVLQSAHQSGDWAALTWTYTLPEGFEIYISALAVKLDSGDWKLLLPSLQVESDSKLEFVKQYLREGDESFNQVTLKELRQQGLDWARKQPDFFDRL